MTVHTPDRLRGQRAVAAQGPRWQTLLLRPEAATFALLVLCTIVASRLSPYFADVGFILESATYYVELCIIAVMLTMVIVAGEIDLSPAAMMALSACLFGVCYRAGMPVIFAMLVALAGGLVMGAFNGVLVTVLRLPSIIVTIGTLIFYRGLAQVLVGDKSIGGYPHWFVGIDFRMLAGIPVPVVIFVAVSCGLGLLLGSTIVGRQIYQIGTNEVAARHAGIRVDRIKMGLFLASGFTSAVGGLMAASRLGTVRYDLATGGELQAVLIVMLGGTYIFGGRGTILGTFLAAWLLIIIVTGMTVADIPITSQLTVMGVLLIVAIVATNLFYARSRR